MSWKDTGIDNPGTSIKYGADDLEMIMRMLKGVTTGIEPVTIKSQNKWGFWDGIMFIRNQADTKNTIIRGQANSPSTNIELLIPPMTANDEMAVLTLGQSFTGQKQFDAGWLLKAQSPPSNPAATTQHYYIDAADNHFKRKKSDGSITDFDTQLAGEAAGANKNIQYNSSGILAAEAGFEYDAAVNEATIPGLTVTENLILSGVITPTQITTDQNNYNPTGLATASTLRLTSDTSRNITGLVAQPGGTLLIIHNVGSFAITMKDESASSTDVNRFAFTNDLTLPQDNSATIKYDGITNRWRLLSSNAATSGVALLAANNIFAVSNQFDDFIDSKIISAPGNPSSGYNRIYSKLVNASNDGLFVKQKVNGSVVEVQYA